MNQTQNITRIPAAPLPAFDPADVVRHAVDAHREVADATGRVVARCSLWWRRTPSLARHRVGLIGHYAASLPEAAGVLLERACGELASVGCTLAVGPMDGSSWRPYRFVTRFGTEPPFFLEPENPPEWPQQFVDAGFTPVAHYCSSFTERLNYEDARATLAGVKLVAAGVQVRPLDSSRWEEELPAIYRITTASFRRGFLYQPLSEAEFLAQYQPIRPWVRPELVLVAMLDGRPVGFLFSVPDMLQARRGETIDTVVLKTLAVVPERGCAGLGACLVQQIHRTARELGYRRVIHALMHEANVSLNISLRYAKPFRRYTLFAKPL